MNEIEWAEAEADFLAVLAERPVRVDELNEEGRREADRLVREGRIGKRAADWRGGREYFALPA